MFNLTKFKVPSEFRGRSVLIVQLWRMVNYFVFRNTPQFMYLFRVFLLRVFGAKIGKNVLIRSSADIIYPWKITIGENSWIGEGVILYALAPIAIGSNTIVSQYSHLCAGGHDYSTETFELTARGIVVGDNVWIASDVFVSDGVVIGDGAIIGARATVTKNIDPRVRCYSKNELIIERRLK